MSAVALPHRRTNPAIDLALTETVLASVRAERDLCIAEKAHIRALTRTSRETTWRALVRARRLAFAAREDLRAHVAMEGKALA